MAAILIPQSTTFGGLTNQVVGRLTSLNSNIPRLTEALATASSGYDGTPGTEFEAGAGNMMLPTAQNNFGIVPDSDVPGQQGEAYRYAVENLAAQWGTFWTAAQAYIAALDNGAVSL